MRKKPVIPEHKPNEKRIIAKNKRGKGRIAMGNYTNTEWAQKYDPLFKVKGLERYRKIKKGVNKL